jgi:hypothetical protein
VASSKTRGSVFALVLALTWSGFAPCAFADPPHADQLTPGTLRGVTYHPGDAWELGYWEYLPSGFDELADDELLPLLVFLPGIGEYDDDSACPDGADVCAATDCGSDGLCRNLSWGPQSLIRVAQWDEDVRPFIVVSPQNPVPPGAITEWDLDQLDAFFQFVLDNYPVDPRRLYLTGMSQGGRGTLQYVAAYPRRFAGAASMPGGQVQPAASCSFQDTAFWWFHGEDDNDGHLGPGVFNPCLMVELASMYDNPGGYPQYPECVAATGQPRPDGRFTMFYDVPHSSWIPSIDPIGVGFAALEWPSDQGCDIDIEFTEYTAANDSDGIYSWFLGLDRPDVSAPDDLEVPGDGADVELTAIVVDDDAVAYTWTQLDGPAAVLADADAATVTLSGLAPLTAYTFEVFALDADNQWDRDQVVVSVLEAPVGTSGESGDSTAGSSGASSLDSGASNTLDDSGDATVATASATGSDATATSPDGTASAGSVSDTAATGSDDSTGSSETDPASGCACSSRDATRTPLWLLWMLPLIQLGGRRRAGFRA